jgi:hypothetical protein
MANRLFQKWKQAMLTGQFSTDLSAAGTNVKAVLVDTAVHDPDTTITGNEFLSHIPSGARLGTTGNLASKAVVDAVFDAADIALPDAGGGATGEELVVYIDTGVEGTSRLLCVIDTATGLPITLDGTNDTIQWAAGGIFAL